MQKSKDANKSRFKANMIRDRPGGHSFTSGFSQDSISITVGEQITAEQLIEKRIVMKIYKAMIMNIGITSVSSRSKTSMTEKAC